MAWQATLTGNGFPWLYAEKVREAFLLSSDDIHVDSG